jgi:hypothetical protein
VTARFAESVVEDAALAWLTASGWTIAHGPDIALDTLAAERRDYGDVVLAQRLRDALGRLNPALTAEAWRMRSGNSHARMAWTSSSAITWLERRGSAVTSTITMTELLVQPYRKQDVDRVKRRSPHRPSQAERRCRPWRTQRVIRSRLSFHASLLRMKHFK